MPESRRVPALLQAFQMCGVLAEVGEHLLGRLHYLRFLLHLVGGKESSVACDPFCENTMRSQLLLAKSSMAMRWALPCVEGLQQGSLFMEASADLINKSSRTAISDSAFP